MDITIIVTLLLVVGTGIFLYIKFAGGSKTVNKEPQKQENGVDSSKSTKKFQPQAQSQVLVLGLNETGKTSLLYRLKSGEFRNCYASQQVNKMEFPLIGAKKYTKDVKFVDVPGHSRMRSNALREIPRSKGIIFMVDSLLSTTRMPSIAMYLFNILTQPAVIEQQIPLLIVCNKSATALYHVKHIKKLIEKELESMVRTRKRDIGTIVADDGEEAYELVEPTDNSKSSLLDSDSDSDEDEADAKPFNFDSNCRSPVEFLDADVFKQINIEDIQSFVERVHQ